MANPEHIVIVPDGNRRWAKAQGKPAFFGHEAGAEAVEKILETALDLKIRCLTIWGASVANVTERSAAEIQVLFKIFETYFKKLAEHKLVRERKVRVDFLGAWERLFPASLIAVMRKVKDATKDYDGHRLTFLMAYDGREEMLSAVKALRDSGDEITAANLKRNLWTKDLPPVDLAIRTAGEPHWSAGMMMWDVAEARLHFTPTLWPAFAPAEFTKILKEYSDTERRFGK